MSGNVSIEEHEAVGQYNNVSRASDATQVADITPLHPPGTFAKNTQIGDAVNGLARDLGVKAPNNVVKLPRK